MSAIERKRLRDEGKADAEKDFLAGNLGKKKRKLPEDEVNPPNSRLQRLHLQHKPHRKRLRDPRALKKMLFLRTVPNNAASY